MKVAPFIKLQARRTVLLTLLVLLVASVGDARAQWSKKWLAIGRFQHEYLSGGAEPENLGGKWLWPGIRSGVVHNRWKGLWVSALDWKDPEGNAWEVRNAHIGPRGLGLGEMFDITHELHGRFEKPRVSVDGLETFQRPIILNRVDPALGGDQEVISVINTSLGLTITRNAKAFAQDYHDSYHIVEYTLTNTGNIDDDPDIELEGQNLKQVYLVLLDRPTANTNSGEGANYPGSSSWGRYTMNDAVAPATHEARAINPQYGVDFRAQFSWVGYTPEREANFHALGQPIWYSHSGNPVRDDTLGRLGAAQMAGQVVLHADSVAHPATVDRVNDDRDQPRLMTYMDSDYSDMTTGNDHTNVDKNKLERLMMYRGNKDREVAPSDTFKPRTWPTHAYVVEPSGDFANSKADPSRGLVGGWGFVNGFGPYDIKFGEVVKIVVAEGVAGLSDEAAFKIGRAYKQSAPTGGKPREDVLIPFDANKDGTIDPAREVMTKNRWVMTSRDSLFQLFARARANYQSGYEIPRPPRPPKSFEVTSGTDKITLKWDAFENPPAGWEIWRAANEYYGVPGAKTVVGGVGVPDSARVYQRIATLNPDARSYEDANVERGISYFYYLQAVGNVNDDDTGMTPTGIQLKSSRYFAQTYEPAYLRRSPGGSMEEIVVVPNPYIIGSEANVRFPDKQDKVAFYGLPGQATIKIYTEIGELVNTIKHTDGSGDEFWYLLTENRQLISSGLYLAVITNDDTGEQLIRKILIVR